MTEPCSRCGTYCGGRHDGSPIEAVDIPAVGEIVEYEKQNGSLYGIVTAVATHDGDVDLRFEDGSQAVDVKPGMGLGKYHRLRPS